MDNNTTIIDQEEIQQEFQFERASRGIRFLNWLIDYIVILILAIFTAPFIFSYEVMTDNLTSRLIGVLYYVVYYIVIESATGGKSIGKLLTRTRAVKDDGEKATFGDFLKRSFSRIIPFEPFSMFGDSPWHDSIADMMVIKEESNA